MDSKLKRSLRVRKSADDPSALPGQNQAAPSSTEGSTSHSGGDGHKSSSTGQTGKYGITVCSDGSNPIVDAEKHIRPVQERTVGIVFMGTPHHGSNLEAWASLGVGMTQILKSPNKELLAVLGPDSEMLAHVQRDFHSLLRNRKDQGSEISMTCFFEELPYPIVGEVSRRGPARAHVFNIQQVVPKHSAIIAGYASYGIHANHKSMVRFQSAQDPGYDAVLGEIQRWMKSLVLLEGPDRTLSDIEAELLRSLHFEDLHSRVHNIADPVEASFQWLWDEDGKTGFLDWLRCGKGLFWITGKPGSGKSTLMKSILKTPRQAAEQYCAPGSETRDPLGKMIIIAHFFDHNGSNLARSVGGLLRSLLHQILLEIPSSFRAILPRYEEKRCIESQVSWHEAELKEIFLAILKSTSQIAILILVDALDEYDGDDMDIAEVITHMAIDASASLKLCVASRPYPDFMYQFQHTSNFRLEKHTSGDIQAYVSKRFNAAVWSELEHNILVRDLLKKAQGVFLWVKVVSNDILRGYRRFENIKRLRERLTHMPTDLMDVYFRILDCLEENDQELVRRILLVIQHAKSSLWIWDLDYLVAQSYDPPRPCGALSESRVIAVCYGLLELEGDQDPLTPNHKFIPAHETVSTFTGYLCPESALPRPLSSPQFHEYLLQICLYSWMIRNDVAQGTLIRRWFSNRKTLLSIMDYAILSSSLPIQEARVTIGEDQSQFLPHLSTSFQLWLLFLHQGQKSYKYYKSHDYERYFWSSSVEERYLAILTGSDIVQRSEYGHRVRFDKYFELLDIRNNHDRIDLSQWSVHTTSAPGLHDSVSDLDTARAVILLHELYQNGHDVQLLQALSRCQPNELARYPVPESVKYEFWRDAILRRDIPFADVLLHSFFPTGLSSATVMIALSDAVENISEYDRPGGISQKWLEFVLSPGFSIHVEKQNYGRLDQQMRAFNESYTPLCQVLRKWLRIRDSRSINIEQRWIMLLWIKALMLALVNAGVVPTIYDRARSRGCPEIWTVIKDLPWRRLDGE
ncbi:hypothetical protein OEA41_000123, partial [Lepraria neglecta]